MKIVLVCTVASVAYNFRKGLIEKLQQEGHSVVVVLGEENGKDKVEALGVEVFVVQSSNTSINPFKKMAYQKKLVTLFREISPDIVFSFMLTPAIFASKAAKRAGVKKVFAMIEGMGRVFTIDSFKNKLIRIILKNLMRSAFKGLDGLFVLNSDDYAFFKDKNYLKNGNIIKVNGIGVPLDEFVFAIHAPQSTTFLLVARLMREKGIIEFCEASEIVKKEKPEARFLLVGGEENVTKSDIEKYEAVEYLGTTDNIKEVYQNCSVFVLPSYREGLPRSIMEAMAIGRAIITTNVPGCKDMIDGNGYIVPKKDIQALANKMIELVDNPELIEQMGIKSRKLAEERYNENDINQQIMEAIL